MKMKTHIPQNQGEIVGAKERVAKIIAGNDHFEKNKFVTKAQIKVMEQLAYEGFENHRNYISLPQFSGDSVTIGGAWPFSPCEISADGSMKSWAE
jgi:hypothetical protein